MTGGVTTPGAREAVVRAVAVPPCLWPRVVAVNEADVAAAGHL